MTPRTIFEVVSWESMICTGVTRTDGMVVPVASYQAKFDAAVVLNRFQSAVQAAVATFPSAIVMAEMDAGTVTVEVDASSVNDVKSVIASQFAGQSVSVIPNG
jgi:hypothetical protein